MALRALLLASLLALPLAACEMKMAGETHAPIVFTDNAPLQIDVARIEVIEQFKPPLTKPHVEHLAPVPPAHALRNWARDRMQANGSEGVAKFTIVDASVTQEPLKKTEGLKGLITTDQAVRLRVDLKVRIDVDAGSGQGFAEAVASRSKTVPEDMTIAERDAVLHALVTGAAKELDRVIERNARAHLRPFLLN